jgi:hypothetical protein
MLKQQFWQQGTIKLHLSCNEHVRSACGVLVAGGLLLLYCLLLLLHAGMLMLPHAQLLRCTAYHLLIGSWYVIASQFLCTSKSVER